MGGFFSKVRELASDTWGDAKEIALPALGAAGGFALGGPVGAGIGLGLAGGIGGSKAKRAAAKNASASQIAASNQGVGEQRNQYEIFKRLMSPYTAAGVDAIRGQEALLGLNGRDSQQRTINEISGSPLFKSLNAQGQDAILQNASATGGLRGGNVQGALAQFSPQLLNKMIQQRFNNLGSIATRGQSASTAVGEAGINKANQITNQFGQQGAAQAGYELARGKDNAAMWEGLGEIGGFMGGGGFGETTGGGFWS